MMNNLYLHKVKYLMILLSLLAVAIAFYWLAGLFPKIIEVSKIDFTKPLPTLAPIIPRSDQPTYEQNSTASGSAQSMVWDNSKRRVFNANLMIPAEWQVIETHGYTFIGEPDIVNNDKIITDQQLNPGFILVLNGSSDLPDFMLSVQRTSFTTVEVPIDGNKLYFVFSLRDENFSAKVAEVMNRNQN